MYHATNAHNGLWLCENHHKLFDENIISINCNGELIIKDSLKDNDKQFISNITIFPNLSKEIMTEQFIFYLNQRNAVINF